MLASEKVIRQWRIVKGEPFGLMLWFDPSCEAVRLFETLPPRDSEGVDVPAEGVDGGGEVEYLDKIVSVSGLDEDETPGSKTYEQIGLFKEDSDLPF